MRRLSLTLILFFLSLNLAAAQGRDDKKQHDLVGPVKTVEAGRIEYTVKDGKSVAGRRLPSHKITFNEAGNKTEEISYDQDGSITSRTVYAYDKAGRIQGYDTYSSVTDKSLTEPQKNLYKLDDKGNVVEYTNYQTDGTPASKFLYKYDAQGNKL